MAKRKKSSVKATGQENKKNNILSFFKRQEVHLALGVFVFSFSIFLILSFFSFFNHWKQDQSELGNFSDRSIAVQNMLGKTGASISHFFIYEGFGLAIFIFPVLLFFTGLYIILNIPVSKLKRYWLYGILAIIWLSSALSFSLPGNDLSGGKIGYEVNDYLQVYLGKTGNLILLISTLLLFFITYFRITPQKLKSWIPKRTPKENSEIEDITEEGFIAGTIHENLDKSIDFNLKKKEEVSPIQELDIIPRSEEIKEKLKKDIEEVIIPDLKMEVEKPISEEQVVDNLSNKLVEEFGEFDPKLDLPKFQFPSIELLNGYNNENININKEELEENKNTIVETLSNYNIGIDSIKATIGPTVTLYEIVPKAGVRISKIKNLEDDIALSLAALGIRIIAPIPGKGTIGIEVPNKNPSVVSMKSVLASQKFQSSKMELPIALGKTISNETYVVDLAKMPHLLMAGATGQGKSVGLNAVLASLIYKKHPAEVKFVLVDPKKVELTLFNKIERHYLAKLPDTEEAIITDTKKVINTLNSLCIEMDHRYDLLKMAFVRNIKEYNEKFKQRKLNPENGHQYLPYIVLVIDEFADLIMTAGKEIEAPIARLAQLARAIGIHLIVATQRPSVNVITGIIKANFPTRIAFRVTSKIDSRTILDSQGADQLIGKGDMLISTGSELTRLQCAFIDTPEVEKITEFIGSQKAYPDAYLLPEYDGDDDLGTNLDIDISERDPLFEEAAKVIVIAQQGSASLLQRKLKLGYNRAGRLIDQLEAANIVGPFEGSKARQVLVNDMLSLETLLASEQ
ncbi:MAG: DNA translocase FtsK 4TM domain-containing protein [Lutimonas sp.]